jgi:hypothetical protein
VLAQSRAWLKGCAGTKPCWHKAVLAQSWATQSCADSKGVPCELITVSCTAMTVSL